MNDPLLSRLVARMIASVLGVTPGDVTAELLLVEDLGCDSLHIVTIAADCETELLIDLPDADLDRWHTVSDVMASVAGQKALAP